MEFRLDVSQTNINRIYKLYIEPFDENNVHFVLSDGHNEHWSLYDDFVYYLGKPAKIMECDVLNNIILRHFIFYRYDDNFVLQPCRVVINESCRKVRKNICTNIGEMPGFNPLCIRVPNGVATVVSAVSESEPEPELATAELCK
jgi:hypothetical protein